MSFRGNTRGRGRGRGGSSGFGARQPKLPAALMAEVESSYGAPRNLGGARGRKDARKAARKGPSPQDRQQYRQQRDEEDSRPALSAKAAGKRRASPEPETDNDDQPEPARKKAKADKEDKPKKLESKAQKAKKERFKELVLPQDDVDVEDREIAWLEYMLANEKKGEDDMEDDLDDLLDFAGKLGPGGKGIGRGDVSDDDEMESDMDEEEFAGFDDDLSDDEEVDLSEGNEEEDEDEDEEEDDEEEGSDDDDEEHADEAHVDLSEDNQDDKPSDFPAEDETPSAEAAASSTTGRYLPPHMRAAALAEKAAGDSARVQERAKLERKAQGLLNKLSEANIESILAEVEKLFGEYSRNDVTTTITTLVIQMIGSKTNLLDSFVVLYATLVGALHRVIGIEFGAHFVQTLVHKYNELINAADKDNEEDDAYKEAHNLLTLIAELYNAGVVGAGLVYDLVRGFIGDGVMAERSVEGLLKILKCCGSQLRADDSASLKDIVALVQERTRGKDKEMTTRARFMVETLVNLQNGKKKGLGTEREDVARMRKYLGGMGKKRRLLAPEPIRVSLTDLLNADSRGKWWLVGAGWSGNPLVERGDTITVGKKEKKKAKAEQEDEEVLLELARKQGMNTDVRRSVFVTLLTSEDYIHACDRLNAFRLTQVQQREFVRVALHCCGMETNYNPYYTLVLNNLCANSYDHRFTLQYALWDLLRELGEGAVTDSRASHVARALAFCFARGSVDVTILKAADFTDLSKPTRKFFDNVVRSTLLAIQTPSPLLTLPRAFKIDDTDIEAVEETFEKALAAPELAGGLAWVMQSVIKNPGKGVNELEGQVLRLCGQAALSVLARAV